MIHFQQENLTVFQSALFKTTTAIVQSKETLIMTDPTWLPHEIEEIRNYVDEHLGNRQFYIIYTHSDFDHIIGDVAFPEAKVIASAAFENNPHKEKVLQDIKAFDQEYYIDLPYEVQYPAVDKVIKKDGETLTLGDLTLTFYQAPGHTADSLFTIVEPFGIFLSGDYLSDVEFPFITSSYQDYVETVDKASSLIKDFDIEYHVPGHGTARGAKLEIMNRIDFSKHYLKKLPVNSDELEKECRRKFRFFEGMKENHVENVKMVEAEK